MGKATLDKQTTPKSQWLQKAETSFLPITASAPGSHSKTPTDARAGHCVSEKDFRTHTGD